MSIKLSKWLIYFFVFKHYTRAVRGKGAIAIGLAGSIALLALIALVYQSTDGDSMVRSLTSMFILIPHSDQQFRQPAVTALAEDNNGGTSGQTAQVTEIFDFSFLSVLIFFFFSDWWSIRLYQE